MKTYNVRFLLPFSNDFHEVKNSLLNKESATSSSSFLINPPLNYYSCIFYLRISGKHKGGGIYFDSSNATMTQCDTSGNIAVCAF